MPGSNYCLFFCWAVAFFVAIESRTLLAATASDSFNEGIKVFQRGDYAQALQYFQQAQSGGFQNPRLYYNLGVTWYKLAQYDQAYEQFSQLTNNLEFAFLAYYNLALCAERQGNLSLALQHLDSAQQQAKSPQEIALLSRLTERWQTARAQEIARPSWSGEISTLIGLNDNFVLEKADLLQNKTQTKTDYFANVGVSTHYRWRALLHTGITAQSIWYIDQRQQNYWQWESWLAWTPRWHWGDLSLGSVYQQSYLDDRSFLQDWQGKTTLRWHNFSAAAEIHTLSPAEKKYDYLKGNYYQLSFSGNFLHPYLNLAYRYENHNRRDFNNPEQPQFVSYSPIRHQVSISWRLPWFKESQFYVMPTFRRSRYKKPDSQISFTQKREDERLSMQLLYDFPLSKRWWLTAEYHLYKNLSNINQYDYRYQNVAIGLAWRF